MKNAMFTFYVIKNLDTGEYLCRVPQSASDLRFIWTSKANAAKVYATIGPARAASTTVSRICYDNDIPKPNFVLVELATEEHIIDDSIRAATAVSKIRNKKSQQQKIYTQQEIQALHQEMAAMARKISQLSGKQQ
jgi:hypothetical protein